MGPVAASMAIAERDGAHITIQNRRQPPKDWGNEQDVNNLLPTKGRATLRDLRLYYDLLLHITAYLQPSSVPSCILHSCSLVPVRHVVMTSDIAAYICCCLWHWCRYPGQKSRWFERAQGRWGLLPAMPLGACGKSWLLLLPVITYYFVIIPIIDIVITCNNDVIMT